MISYRIFRGCLRDLYGNGDLMVIYGGDYVSWIFRGEK